MKNPSWSSALQSCLGHLPSPRHELVPRDKALGRLLLEPVFADRDYPIGHLSMMDGYAIAESAGEPCQIMGENRPGEGPGLPLQSGEARRIFTGAELPENTVRVIPQELVQVKNGKLHIQALPETPFIRQRGSEATKGSRILEPGMRVGPVEQAILAVVGVTQVQVAARPRIAHLVTGSELITPDAASPGSLTRDSNSDLVAATLREAGYSPIEQRRTGDDRGSMIQLIKDLADECDLLLISGGASVGTYDHTRNAFEAAGFQMETHGVDVRPGKPVGLARRQNQWAIALPGNPVSHLVALHLFVLPLLRRWEGDPHTEPNLLRGVLQQPPSVETPKRPTFWPSTVYWKDGGFHLYPRRFLSSGDLIGIAQANALTFFEAGMAFPSAGAEVSFLPLASPFKINTP